MVCWPWYLVASAWARIATYDTAIAIWEDAVSKVPDDPIAHNNLGTVLLKANRNDEAKSEFRRAIQIAPERPIAHRNLGDVFTVEEHFPEAIEAYQQVLALSPDDYKVRNRLAVRS